MYHSGEYIILLCAIRNSDQIKVIARQSNKSEGPFYCPVCKKEANVRKGKIKVHHFAHKPPSECEFGAGETEAHKKCKESIYKALLNTSNVKECELEKNLGENIADIFAMINNVPVAIEIQKSNLSVNEITRRTELYHKNKIYVLWLCLFNKKLNEKAYSPKAWEKWLHALYFGKIYYWTSDLKIIPVHFAKYSTYVEETSWYDEYGEESYGGGYYKKSKRYKTPDIGTSIEIHVNFTPRFKESWNGKNVFLPQCSIYTDNLKPWWKK